MIFVTPPRLFAPPFIRYSRIGLKNSCENNWILRIGELHFAFACLKAIGRFIDNSGLDQIIVDNQIVGSCVLAKIFEGKQYKSLDQKK